MDLAKPISAVFISTLVGLLAYLSVGGSLIGWLLIGWIMSAPLLLIILIITHRKTTSSRTSSIMKPEWAPQMPPESRPEQNENTVFKKM